MEEIKIVTHDGFPHFDETAAIALLMYVSNQNIEVERISHQDEESIQKAKEDENIILLDLGQELDYDKSNLDHHQDKEIPCSLVLMWDWFRWQLITTNVKSSSETTRFLKAKLFMETWGQLIDDLDRQASGRPHREIIADLPQELQDLRLAKHWKKDPEKVFKYYVGYFQTVLSEELFGVNQIIASEAQQVRKRALAGWTNHFVTLDNGIAIGDGVQVPDWQMIAPEHIRFIVSPVFEQSDSSKIKQYSLISKDNTLYPVKADDFNPLFLHPTRFLAAFKTKEEAVKCAIYSLSKSQSNV